MREGLGTERYEQKWIGDETVVGGPDRVPLRALDFRHDFYYWRAPSIL